jgi:hypothetical protein
MSCCVVASKEAPQQLSFFLKDKKTLRWLLRSQTRKDQEHDIDKLIQSPLQQNENKSQGMFFDQEAKK